MTVFLKFGLHYGLLFCVIGLMLPFWPLWLADKGLGPAEIGLAIGITTWVKPVFNPFAGWVADATGQLRRVMMLAAAGSACGFLFLSQSSGLAMILLGCALASGCYFALLPLSETLAMRADKAGVLAYGRVRLWGSLSFIALSLIGGPLIGVWGPGFLPFALAAIAAALVLTIGALPGRQALSQGTEPDPKTKAKQQNDPSAGWSVLFRDRALIRFLLALGAVHASHAVLNAFGSLHWRAAGLSEGFIGWLWAVGVIAEVVLFAASAKAMGRLGPYGLLWIGAIAGLIRWPILALTTDPIVLSLVQTLHGLTYGATHLAAMAYLTGIGHSKTLPEDLTTRAQALYSSVSLGLCVGGAAMVAGPLYGSFSGAAFWAPAVLCGLALWLGKRP
ncbi:MAG: MFS transporter [Rhodospirillaceae bacterium]